MARPQYPIRRLLKPLVSWFGRLGRPNAPSSSFKSCASRATSFSTSSTARNSLHHEIKTDQEFWEMFFTPYIWAGVRYRDISRLWTGAGPTYNEDGEQTSNAQIIAKDPDGQEIDSPQLQACRWLFDQRLKKGSITQLLKEITYSKLLLKKSVHEILWVREEQPEYGVKLSIEGFQHVDPTLFEYNPLGEEPGLYMQTIDEYGNRGKTYTPVDERRFLIITNQEMFSDKNGISELEPLRKTEPRREDAEKSWGRGAQRHGHGHIIGKYGEALRGASASTDRTEFQTMLEEMGTDTVSMTYEGNTIDQLDVDVKAEVFKDIIAEFKAQAGLVLTGSTSTFLDEAGGTKARLESSEKAQESEMEQQDCGEISAGITEQVLWRFCDFNWLDTEVYPKMQIITEEVLAPTLPETQDTQTEILEGEEPDEDQGDKKQEEIQKESRLVKLQDEELPEPIPPVAIPAGYEDFPRDEPISEDYRNVLDYAHDALAEMPVKDYTTVTKDDAPWVFTVKRFRGYTSDMLPILQAMKTAIDVTLDAKTEKDAWKDYYELIVPIFQAHGIPITPQIRNDLNISFRQTRQNVLNEAYILVAQDDDSVKGFEIVPNPNVTQHHPDEIAWYGLKIPKNHVELQRGGHLRPPLNFGCMCGLRKVYNEAELTPESQWPTELPGKTYRYYAQPTE